MNRRRIIAFIIGLLVFLLLFILFRTQLVATFTGKIVSEVSSENSDQNIEELASQSALQDIFIQISPKIAIKNNFNLRVYSEIRSIASGIYSDTLECIDSSEEAALSITECTSKVLSTLEYSRHGIFINENCETETERRVYGQYQDNIIKYCIKNLQSQYNQWHYLRYNGETWVYDKPYYYFALEYPLQ